MPDLKEFGVISVKLDTDQQSLADVAHVIEILDGMVMAGLWGEIFSASDNSVIARCKWILQGSASDYRAQGRFFPSFPSTINRRSSYFEEQFDPFDPLDGGVLVGMNSWARRTLREADSRLASEVMSFAQIKSLRKQSPIVIQLALTIGGVLAIAPVLVWAMGRVANSLRKSDAEATIREGQARIKMTEAEREEHRTAIVRRVRQQVDKEADANGLYIPPDVLTEALKVGVSPVADLGGSSVIKEVNVSLTK